MSEVKSLDDVRRIMEDYDRDHRECPVEKRQREMREAKHEPERATNGGDWGSWTDARVDARIMAALQTGGVLCNAIGFGLGHDRKLHRRELAAELDKLRAEFRDTGDKLREELRDALDRLHVIDQQRRECERALSQTNLDARDTRIAGAIEAVTVKLRNESILLNWSSDKSSNLTPAGCPRFC
jgi:hypothetical protein